MAKDISITELRDKKKQLREASQAIIAKAKAEENRAITSEEMEKLQANKLRMAELDLEIDAKLEENRNLHFASKPKRGFSLRKAIVSKITGKAMEDEEMQMCERGARIMDGLETEANSLVVPFSTKRSVVSASNAATYGGVTVEDEDFVLPLEQNLVLAEAGATIMTGIRGNIRVPAMSAVTVLWDAENDSAGDGAGSISTAKSFSPHRLCAYVDISKQLLLQENQDIEGLIRKLIASAIAQKIESTALGKGASVTDTPNGIFGTLTPAKGTIGWDTIVNLETAVNEAGGLHDSLAYILHPQLWGKAKQVAKSTSGAGGLIMNEGNPLMNGYKVFNTANVAKEMDTSATSTPALNGYGAVFGNWSDFQLLSWGGLDITVDNLSQATAGKIRLVVNSYWDFGPVRTGSFAAAALKLS